MTLLTYWILRNIRYIGSKQLLVNSSYWFVPLSTRCVYVRQSAAQEFKATQHYSMSWRQAVWLAKELLKEQSSQTDPRLGKDLRVGEALTGAEACLATPPDQCRLALGSLVYETLRPSTQTWQSTMDKHFAKGWGDPIICALVCVAQCSCTIRDKHNT